MAAGTLVGLDIGSTSIRGVETSRGRDGLVLTNAGMVPLPPGAVVGGVLHDDKAVTAALKTLWAGSKFRSKHVVLGITNPQVVVRNMSLSNLPPRELRDSLPFQVRDVLPLPPEKSLLDFMPLEDAGNNATVRGVLVAAPKEAVVESVLAVERAGLQVARVDLASFATLRSVSRLDTEVEALVDMGAHATSVIVHANGEPLIVRTILRGSTEITEAIASRVGATLEEAEALKCRIGLNAAEGPETAEVVAVALRPLISEIRSSFAYLTSVGQKTKVARLVLAGGGGLLPGLVVLLSEQLDLVASIADPLMRLREVRKSKQATFDRFRASASVSIGLTLRAG
jgi:type IV pilus assembly protein PilM